MHSLQVNPSTVKLLEKLNGINTIEIDEHAFSLAYKLVIKDRQESQRTKGCPSFEEDVILEYKRIVETKKKMQEALEWVLEGSPRYSAEELEKIFSSKVFYKWRGEREDIEGYLFLPVKTCLDFLRNKEKVQEALK